jgi:hypothetical protein
MDAQIHSTDKDKRNSDGNVLYLKGASLKAEVKRLDGLPFGDHRDQHYVELTASCWDGNTESTLIAHLHADDLKQLFAVAFAADLIEPPVNRRAIELLAQLREELGDKSR